MGRNGTLLPIHENRDEQLVSAILSITSTFRHIGCKLAQLQNSFAQLPNSFESFLPFISRPGIPRIPAQLGFQLGIPIGS
jgi:hypothetical protein